MTHASCNCGYASRGLDQRVSPFSPLYTTHVVFATSETTVAVIILTCTPPGACNLCCNANTVQVHPWLRDFEMGGGRERRRETLRQTRL